MIGDVDEREPGTEADLLRALRRDYEARGFSFVAAPDADALPQFLGGFQPDALARAPGHNVAIVVKRRGGSHRDRSVAEIQRLLSDKPDWSFRVVIPASDPLDSITIGDAASEAVEEQRREVLALSLQGYHRAAFLMAWALLETALHARERMARGRAQAAGAVVQALAMMGRIAPETERKLRGLIAIRNRVAHGDLAARPDTDDVETVLSAVTEAMAETAA